MVQMGEGALNEVHGILQRMRELTVQAGNETLSTKDRDAIGAEMFTLRTEVDNIASRTKFNGLSLLTGSLSTSQSGGMAIVGFALTTGLLASIATVDVSKLKAGTTYTFAKIDANTMSITDGTTTVNSADIDATIGADGELTLTFTGAITASVKIVGATGFTNGDIGTAGLTVITAAGSGSANFRVGANGGDDIVVAFDDAIVDVSSQRAKLGAAQNQVETAVASLGVAVENLAASESHIRDADIAEVSTELVTRQIMQQAGVAVLSQANTSAQGVLSLLQ